MSLEFLVALIIQLILQGVEMLPLFRTCLPLAIAAALCLPNLPSEAQQQSPAATKPAPPKPKHGPTPHPIACAKRLAGVDAGQTESFGFWMRAQGQPEDDGDHEQRGEDQPAPETALLLLT